MKHSSLAGHTILELLIALGVFSLVIVSVIPMLMGSRSLVTDSPQALFATGYAQEGLEAARLLRDQDWDNLVDGDHGLGKNGANWEFTGTQDSANGYTRVVTVAPHSAYSKRITSRVSWVAPGSRSVAIQFSGYLTDWRQAQNNNEISGDWTNPTTAGTGDVDSGVAGTDVLVQNNKVYVSSSASQFDKADLTIFDVTNPATPVRISSVHLGVSNISSITKVGDYVYASIANSSNEFMIINVADPNNPTVVNSIDFSNGKSQTLTVSGNTLYIGMERITGESEFFAVNVSDPSNPQVIGNFEVDANVSSIYIFNNRAYVSTWKDDAELIVLDVANPASITKMGEYDATGTEDATSIFVKDESNVYIGRDQSSTGEEFIVLDCLNPATITRRGGMHLTAGINDLVVINYLAFTVTEQPNAEFRVLNIADLNNIYSYSFLNFPQAATGIAFENNTIYSSVRSNQALRIIKSGP